MLWRVNIAERKEKEIREDVKYTEESNADRKTMISHESSTIAI